VNGHRATQSQEDRNACEAESIHGIGCSLD
jgi:hypothetical protein